MLAILAGGLGDKLMALPAIRSFRSQFPGKDFTLVIIGITPPFFDAEADDIISVSENDTFALFQIARRGFDACFVNSIGIFDVRCEVAAFLCGSRDLRGPVHDSQRTKSTIYSIPYRFGAGHETVINFRGAGAGASTEQMTLDYVLDWKPAAESLSVPDILFHPGSSSTGVINRWPPAFFAEVAREFAQRNQRILAIGSPSERPLLEEIRSKSGGALEIRHDLNLRDLVPLLAGAGVVVANDSGIGHLAASVGANLITLMGANRPERVAPVGKLVRVIGPRCEFGGCYGTPHAAACKLCIEKISPDEVIREIERKFVVLKP